MAGWREPGSGEGDWTLLAADRADWVKQYGSGQDLTCGVCRTIGQVDLSPAHRTATYPCGHVLELPSPLLT